MAKKSGVKSPKVRGNLSRNIYVGKKPPSKDLSWWYLSPQAKRLLDQKRREGMFGGMPGKAPYWMAQEAGEPKASVEALFYIKRALAVWEAQAHAKVASYFRAGGK